jgi:hypothetical protein
VIGKIVLTMLVAAAKINQSSIGLHYHFSYAPSASDIASPSPEFRWTQSCLAIFEELRILLLRALISSSERNTTFK